MERIYKTSPRKIFYTRSPSDKMLKELLSGEFDNIEYKVKRKKPIRQEFEREDAYVRYLKITKYPSFMTMLKSSLKRFVEEL